MVYVEPRTGKIMRRGLGGTRAVPPTIYCHVLVLDVQHIKPTIALQPFLINLSFTASRSDVYITAPTGRVYHRRVRDVYIPLCAHIIILYFRLVFHVKKN